MGSRMSPNTLGLDGRVGDWVLAGRCDSRVTWAPVAGPAWPPVSYAMSHACKRLGVARKNPTPKSASCEQKWLSRAID